MNIKDIFGEENSECYFNENGQRLAFSLSNQCRLYRYDKKIGVCLSVYFDHIDEMQLDDALSQQPVVSDINYGFDVSVPGPQIAIKVLAHNYTTGNDDVVEFTDNKSTFNMISKKTARAEVLLSPEHINDDSVIHLQVKCVIGNVKYVKRALFSRNKSNVEIRTFNPKGFELETTLTEERRYPYSNNNYSSDQNGGDYYSGSDNNWSNF